MSLKRELSRGVIFGAAPNIGQVALFAAESIGIACVYYVLAKFGLSLAQVNPSATPIWPPTGFALAIVLIRGYRVSPAIFVGALFANFTTAGTFYTSMAIASGNTLEALVAALLITTWSSGRNTFDSSVGVAKFASASVIGTLVSATIGVGSLAMAGFAAWTNFFTIWRTWWLGDLAGAVVITPVMVLWTLHYPRTWDRDDIIEAVAIFVLAAVIGLIAFVPVTPWTESGRAAAFLIILPLIWAALRRGQRDTATVVIILAAFAVWGTYARGGPFVGTVLNDSFFLLLVFMISISVPSLALSADVAVRKRTEEELRRSQEELDHRVQVRTQALIAEIEQRKCAEFEREQQRLQLLEAQRLANLGSWVWNVADGRFTWSDHLRKIFGITDTNFRGTVQDFLNLVHPDDNNDLREAATMSLREGRGFLIEHRIIRSDGSVRFLRSGSEVVKDEESKITQMLGICQDITESKEAEIALQRSERNYRLLIEGVRDHAIFMLDPNGHVVSWNPGAERIQQYETHEIIGKHISEFYTDEEKRANIPARALEIAASEGQYETEGLRVRKDGSCYWANALITAIRNDDDKLIGFAKIARDITAAHEAKRKLEETREQLFQAQKMEAIGQLTGGVAHDFNNLLTAIMGSASIIERIAGDNGQLLRNARNIRYAADRGANLTRQLLSFSRRQSLRPELIDLRQRLPLTVELLAHSLRADIKVATHVDADLHPILVDTGELDLALLNVAVNAQDAMPAGGRLTLRVHNLVMNGVGGATTDFIAISLTDTGTGMTPEVQAKIFEPFFTTKEAGKGSGLGLSQVYGFARQSGGDVRIESRVGEGTTLTILLPAASAVGTAIDAVKPEGRETGSNATILLIEDDPGVARTTRETLRSMGYQVHHAADASAALAIIEKTPSIDVVFSDVVMPGMNGVELARALRKSHPDLPILLTSGFSDAVSSAAAKEFELLRKPYAPNDLKSHIDLLLRTSRA